MDVTNLVSAAPRSTKREELMSYTVSDVHNLVSGTPTARTPMPRMSAIDKNKARSVILRGGSSPAMRGTGRQLVVESAKKQKHRLLSQVKSVVLDSVDESVFTDSSAPNESVKSKKRPIEPEELEKIIADIEEEEDEDFEDLVNVLFVLALAMALLCAGAIVFWHLEGSDCSAGACSDRLPLIDAFYLSGMTLTTIGYGDFSPTNDASRVFMVLYSLAGLGVFSALIDVLGKWREKLPFEGDVTGAVVALGIVLGAGALLFSHMEGLEASHALYLSFVTATTVGYGDFSPKTTGGKIGTVLYAMLSLSAMGYFCSFIGDNLRDCATAMAQWLRGGPKRAAKED